MMEPYINKLPDELIIEIFTYLDLETVLSCENVSERWHRLADDLHVWNHIPIVYSALETHKESARVILDILNTHSQLVKHIKLQYLKNYPDLISILNMCSNITKLEISMCQISSQFADDLRKWPQLQLLHFPINMPSSAQDEYNFDYGYYEKIMSLSLPKFGLCEKDFNSMLNCKHLENLFLSKVQFLSQGNVVALLSKFNNNIKSLQLYGGKAVNDEILKIIGDLKSLKNLAIIRCENLSDKALSSLSSLRNLVYLQLWNNDNFSENALNEFLSSPSLHRLEFLSFSRIKNVSPKVIDVLCANYSKLKFLSIYQCPMVFMKSESTILRKYFPKLTIVDY